MKQQMIIGVSGGSGSGKSFFCKQFVKLYKKNEIILICADHYFKNKLPKMISPLTQREYDDWNSIESVDYEALLIDLKEAMKTSAKIIIIEGVNIFSSNKLREMLQLKIFIDTDIEIRLYRRIKRNMKEFNMKMDDIATYFVESAKFQEEKYSISTKIYADIIFNGAKNFDIPIRFLDSYIRLVLGSNPM